MEKIINRLMESPTGLTSTYRSDTANTDRFALASSHLRAFAALPRFVPALLLVNGPFRGWSLTPV